MTTAGNVVAAVSILLIVFVAVAGIFLGKSDDSCDRSGCCGKDHDDGARLK
jgi:hypothetical protein